ncbi:MAG: MBOAT family protein [Lachnospiraceae bacterium]|nr:MBOAT family protein [Lachnospiraceae bacterium]
MIFSSLTFLLIFLPITLLLYYLVPGIRLKNAALLLCSLIFYAWGEPLYILLMLYSIFMNYVCGLLMDKHKKMRRQVLIFGIIINLFLLGFFKYAGFLSESVSGLFGSFGVAVPARNIALPIGISFYTFQALSYLIDLYRGKFPVQKSFVRFALYITMFPQLIAGPIVRYESIAKELEKRTISPAKFGQGALLLIEGLAMKVLLANQIGTMADELRAMSTSLSTVSAWLGALAYFFQIYFDFAGYSTMAIGLGLMLGFTFTKNFDHPYMSTSVTEFWRRWHISLGTWFREYVYIPLGGNRVGTLKHIRNILVVWILTGLWHGAAWNFVLWGLYYGILLLLEKFVLLRLRLPKVIGWIYTTILVLVGWVIFSGETLIQSMAILSAMFGNGTGFFDKTALYYLSTGGIILFLCAISSTPILGKLRGKLLRTTAGRTLLTLVYVGLLALAIMFLAVQNYNPFLYFRF